MTRLFHALRIDTKTSGRGGSLGAVRRHLARSPSPPRVALELRDSVRDPTVVVEL